jgi:hypothetical protein
VRALGNEISHQITIEIPHCQIDAVTQEAPSQLAADVA